MENKGLDEKHAIYGELLRPEEQTADEFVVNNVVKSIRECTISRSTKETEPHQIKDGKVVKLPLSKLDKELETLEQENTRMIDLLMKSEVSVTQLQKYFSDRDKELERIIPEINRENEVTYGYAKSIYHEHYNLRHLGWIEKTRRQTEHDINIGVLNMPLNANTWTDDQRNELFRTKQIYAYIEDPKDFYKFDHYLKRRCALYDSRENPARLSDDCPCIQNTILSEGKSKRTPLHVAVASNFHNFLKDLTQLSYENEHAKWLITRWMYDINRKGKLIAQNDGFNIFFDLISSYDGDITDTWDALLAPEGPFYVLTNSPDFVCFFNIGTSRHIYTPEYLSCAYPECGVTHLLIQGHIKQAYEVFVKYYESMSRAIIPGFLVELFRTDYKDAINLFSNVILEWAKLDRYISVPLRELIFPARWNGRYPDTFIHAIIRRGDVDVLKLTLNFINRIYTERNAKIQQINVEREKAQVALFSFDDQVQDLDRVINIDELNPLEFAIEHSETEIVEYLKEFGMTYHKKYEYLRWYADLMNGNASADDLRYIGHLLDNYPTLHALTFTVTMERDDLTEKILCFYHQTGYSDSITEDLNQALMAALYPRTTKNAAEKKSLISKTLADIVAMLLLAGATLENFSWFRGINNIPTSIPFFIRYLIAEVFKARRTKSFAPSFQYLEHAYSEIFSYFGIPPIEKEL